MRYFVDHDEVAGAETIMPEFITDATPIHPDVFLAAIKSNPFEVSYEPDYPRDERYHDLIDVVTFQGIHGYMFGLKLKRHADGKLISLTLPDVVAIDRTQPWKYYVHCLQRGNYYDHVEQAGLALGKIPGVPEEEHTVKKTPKRIMIYRFLIKED